MYQYRNQKAFIKTRKQFSRYEKAIFSFFESQRVSSFDKVTGMEIAALSFCTHTHTHTTTYTHNHCTNIV
jgi:hypothetical protein